MFTINDRLAVWSGCRRGTAIPHAVTKVDVTKCANYLFKNVFKKLALSKSQPNIREMQFRGLNWLQIIPFVLTETVFALHKNIQMVTLFN